MGVYDFVIFEAGVALPDFEPEGEPWQHTFQTRAFRDCAYRVHCITADGTMYRARHEYESNGLARDGFGLVEHVDDEAYRGTPRSEWDVTWYPVRFHGPMRVTCQTDPVPRYDLQFDSSSLESVEQATLD